MSFRRHGQVSSPWHTFGSEGAAVGAGRCPINSGSAARRSRGTRRVSPADQCATLQSEAFEDPREIVGSPAMPQDEGHGDGLRISARREVPRMLAKEIVEAFVDVELLDQEFQQAR